MIGATIDGGADESGRSWSGRRAFGIAGFAVIVSVGAASSSHATPAVVPAPRDPAPRLTPVLRIEPPPPLVIVEHVGQHW
jgi:hypothetical protein